MQTEEFIAFLSQNGYGPKRNGNNYVLKINNNTITIDIKENKYAVEGITPDHMRITDLTKEENFCVVMLLIKLFKKGYAAKTISLEKQWQLGHESSGYLDVMLTDPDSNSIYMIEVKRADYLSSYVNIGNEKKLKQAFSYAIQEKTTKIVSFYSYDFREKKDYFYNVFTDQLLQDSKNTDDFFERWNKVFDRSDYIVNNPIFNIKRSVKTYENLYNIENEDTKVLYGQFLTILRLHSISDKPNAFMKMINLLLAKISDEISYNKVFRVEDKHGNVHEYNGVKFQYIVETDTPKTFIKRINELYKYGMREYLHKTVIDYSDEEIEAVNGGPVKKELSEIIDDLRSKNSNNFSFIEVYDDSTFVQNFEVLRDIVELLQNYRFKYDTKHPFLGDFFEALLNTSLKQEAGQFFTPYPITEFMVNALPYKQFIDNKLQSHEVDFIPKVIDYACGAGHFLISSMSRLQNLIHNIPDEYDDLTPSQKVRVNRYISEPYSWVNNNNVVGIDKDYRLAKTTKISTFLNGAENAEIITGDGINKFDCTEYSGTVLYSQKKKNEKFDFLIANPPFSIDGFMRNFAKNGIDNKSNDFSLLKSYNTSDSAIEKYFVERAEQLVVKDGYIAIILPQSVLSNCKYEDLRRFILSNFRIYGLLLTSDITFSGTTTSPVVLFMQKIKIENPDYDIMLMCSPKYLTPTASKLKEKEVGFLGYEFSSNRMKSGISIKTESVLKSILPYIQKFILGEDTFIDEALSDYVFVKNINDILLNKGNNYVGDIYPKYTNVSGVPLKEYCELNIRTESDFEVLPKKYVEISDLFVGKLGKGHKQQKTNRFCKAGDILLSGLCPSKDHVVISDGEYMVSPAIHVLSEFDSEKTRDFVYDRLRDDSVLKQMNSLLDGFKITYAKISDGNLMNNVKI